MDKVNELHLITRVPKNIRIKPLGLSLNGLLEYDDKDKDENTFEVSLCGEFFQDMLKKQFGDVIRKALEKYRDSKSIDSSEPPAKKQKIEVDSDVTTGVCIIIKYKFILFLFSYLILLAK